MHKMDKVLEPCCKGDKLEICWALPAPVRILLSSIVSSLFLLSLVYHWSCEILYSPYKRWSRVNLQLASPLSHVVTGRFVNILYYNVPMVPAYPPVCGLLAPRSRRRCVCPSRRSPTSFSRRAAECCTSQMAKCLFWFSCQHNPRKAYTSSILSYLASAMPSEISSFNFLC